MYVCAGISHKSKVPLEDLLDFRAALKETSLREYCTSQKMETLVLEGQVFLFKEPGHFQSIVSKVFANLINIRN